MKTRLIVCIALAAVLYMSACASALAQVEWPMFRHDEQRTGLVSATDDDVLGLYRPKPIWIFPYPRALEGVLDNDRLDLDPPRDDPNFSATGDWTLVPDVEEAYNSDYLFADAASKDLATKSATWKFEWTGAIAQTSADFRIYVWFPSSNKGIEGKPRCRDAHYTVKVNGRIVGEYKIDQTYGGWWEDLGGRTFYVAPVAVGEAQTIEVILTNETDRRNDDGSVVQSCVVADAVMIEQDGGAVHSSPVVSDSYSLVMTCVTRNISLDAFGGFSGALDLGFIYGIFTEDDPATAGTDERGFQKWQFPAEDHNWIQRGISSTPTLADHNGYEVAVIPAADGTVYAIKTETGALVWRGPGYFIDDPTSTVSGTETWLAPALADANAGYHDYEGNTYKYVKAVPIDPDPEKPTVSTATWSQTVRKKGWYAVCIWIPPSTATERYIPDAWYTVTTPTVIKRKFYVNQGQGGQWVRLSGNFSLDIGDNISVELSNETGLGSTPTPPGFDIENAYVVADAVKIIPADLGSFEYSSPLVKRGSKPDPADPSVEIEVDYIYVGCKSGRVYKLEIGSPDPAWTYPDPNDATYPHPIGPVYASPALSKGGGTVYIGSTDGHVYALSTSGVLQWVYPLKPPPDSPLDPANPPKVLPQISSTTAIGDYVYVGLGGWGSQGYDFNPEGRVLALNEGDGTPAWWYPAAPPQPNPQPEGVGAFVRSSPLLMDTKDASGNAIPGLFIGSTDGKFYGIKSQTGAGLIESGVWPPPPPPPPGLPAYPAMGGGMYSSPAGAVVAKSSDREGNSLLNKPMAFVGTNGDRICRVNLDSSSEKKDWWWDLFGAVQSSPALHSQRIYVGDMGGFTWAFSTRAVADDGGGFAQEGWNMDVGAEPQTTGSDTDDTGGRQAKPRIDVFLKDQYDAFLAAAEASRSAIPPTPIVFPDGKASLDELARGAMESQVRFKYEWGETIYIIVWNLLDPNEKPKTGTPIRPGELGFQGKLEAGHRVTMTMKSVDTGKGADVSETRGMEGKSSYFVGKTGDDDRPVFYATLEYTLSSSGPNKPQTPGSEFEMYAKEIVSRTSKEQKKDKSSEEVYVPRQHPVTEPLAEPYEHQRFQINNPLGLICVTPGGNVPIGVVPSGDDVRTTHDTGFANENGNDLQIPYEWGGYTSHNTTSPPMDVTVCDRSHLFKINQSITKFRLELHDLKWLGGPARVQSPIDPNWQAWETQPADNRTGTPNISEDYPDIPGRQISMLIEGRDPAAEPVHLRASPLQLDPNVPVPTEWPVGKNPADITVSVPRFQPANLPDGTSQILLENTGYKCKIFAYVDSNSDGRLQKPADPSMPDTSRKVSNVEAYREFTFGVHVPADRRARVEETMIDIGEVPHGFGVVPGQSGQPLQFHDNLADNLLSFAEWFRPFTAYNIGNTNLLNLRLGLLPNWPGLLSDVVQDTSAGPLPPPGLYAPSGPFGFYIPSGLAAAPVADQRGLEACLASSLDPLFWDDAVLLPPILALNRPRTFHKARVGETEPMLTVPDLPEWLHREYNFNPQQNMPKVSVAVPVGQPAGRYFGPLTLFEDGAPRDDGGPNPADGVYGVYPVDSNDDIAIIAAESVGNPVVSLQVRVREARMTDGFIPGSRPHLDLGPVAGIITGDVTPAAYMDPNTHNLHMVWSSSRYGMDILGSAAPSATDPWYLYISTLERLSLSNPPPTEWRFSSAAPGQWWLKTASGSGAGAPFPAPGTVATLFPWASVDPKSVRFTSPSIATDEPGGVSWLFFSGQAQAAAPAAPGSKSKQIASEVFYEEIEIINGALGGSASTSTYDWTMPKFGVRGAVSRIPFGGGSGSPMLWSFWYGGNNERWRIYYNANPDPDDPTRWTNEAQLPLPKGLSSAAEPSPVFRWWNGQTGPIFQWQTGPFDEVYVTYFDIVYSGYSTFHKNTDIYLSRYMPRPGQASHKEGGHWPVDIVTLPSRGGLTSVGDGTTLGEELTRGATGAIWYSRDVDWVWDAKDIGAASADSGFRVYLYPDRNVPATYHKLNVGHWTKDSTTGAIAFDYSDQPTLRSLVRAVVINPVAGTVRFLKAPLPNARVVAEYRPRAYRLTVDGNIKASDVSPCAVMDDDPNPRYDSNPASNPFYVPPSWSPADQAPPTDRLWVFWRRPGLDKPGTGIHYKAFRYMVRLNRQISVDAATGRPNVTQIDGVTGPITRPVEIDWIKNTLYFAAEDAFELDLTDPTKPILRPKEVSVVYTDAAGVENSNTPEEYTIRFAEDGMSREGAGATTFGTLTSVMVNEGQVNAFKDPYTNKLWVFWTSTRDGSTDIYYEAISPRLYGQRL